MARTTISIPDPLAKRLEPLKDRINVSLICQTALEARVETYERIAALSEEDVMEKLVQRLRIEKEQSSEWSYQKGGEDGQKWAIEDATFGELVEWSNSELVRNTFRDGVPFPESEEAQGWHQGTEDMARDMGEFFNHDAYAQGFLESVGGVWEQVRNRV